MTPMRITSCGSGYRFVLATVCLYVDGILLQRAIDRAISGSHVATEIALLAVLAVVFVLVPARLASGRPVRGAVLAGVAVMAANAAMIVLDLTVLRGHMRLECGPAVYAVSESMIAVAAAVLAGLASGTLCLASGMTSRVLRRAN